MQQHVLGSSGVGVSQLGFGCVQLTSLPNQQAVDTILEAALASGITHFDVARAYGFGRAEGLMSPFVKRHRDEITIATKYGIGLPPLMTGNPGLVTLVKKLLKPFPELLNLLKGSAGSLVKASPFEPKVMVQSLETSLRTLGTEYIDIFLLHESSLAEASSPELIEALLLEQQKGRIRSFGIASAFDTWRASVSDIPCDYPILQFDDHIACCHMDSISELTQGMILHSVFNPYKRIMNGMAHAPALVESFSKQIELNLHDPQVIGDLLLYYAVHKNSAGCVLFSSTDAHRIAKNVLGLETQRLSEIQLLGFKEFVREVLKTL